MDLEMIAERLRSIILTASKDATVAIETQDLGDLRIFVNDMKEDLQRIEDELDGSVFD